MFAVIDEFGAFVFHDLLTVSIIYLASWDRMESICANKLCVLLLYSTSRVFSFNSFLFSIFLVYGCYDCPVWWRGSIVCFLNFDLMFKTLSLVKNLLRSDFHRDSVPPVVVLHFSGRAAVFLLVIIAGLTLNGYKDHFVIIFVKLWFFFMEVEGGSPESRVFWSEIYFGRFFVRFEIVSVLPGKFVIVLVQNPIKIEMFFLV